MVFANGDGFLGSDGLECGVSVAISRLASPPDRATAVPPFWLSSSIVTRRLNRSSGACQCFWLSWRDFALEQDLRICGNLIPTEATWFHQWSPSRATAPWDSMDVSLEYQLRIQVWSISWLHLVTEATALRPFWPASSIFARRCNRASGACRSFWRCRRDIALERTSRHD